MVNKEQIQLLKSRKLNLIPARGKFPHPDFLPLIDGKRKWKPFQTEPYNGVYPEDGNLAVICGRTSDNLVVLDLDSDDLHVYFERFNTFTMSTGKGHHFYFKHIGDELPANIKSFHPTNGKEIDIKSQGGYVISPYSVHEDNKKMYQIVNDAPILEIDFNEVLQVVIDLGFEVSKRKVVDIIDNGLSEGERDDGLFRVAIALRHMFSYSEPELFFLLETFNEKNIVPPLDREQIEKIANSAISYKVNDIRFDHILETADFKETFKFNSSEFWKEGEKKYGKDIYKNEVKCITCNKKFKPTHYDIVHNEHIVKF